VTFLQETLGAADCPVLIAPGHSDPAVPSSPYRYARWPANIQIASHDDLRPYTFQDVRIFAAGLSRSDVPESPLRNHAAEVGGPNLLLLHASDMTTLPQGALPVAPLTPAQIQDCGFGHALLGHDHRGRTGAWLTYPGSPEPLGWDEPAGHCVALCTVSDSGLIDITLEPINQRQFLTESIDVSGMTNGDQVREAVVALRESRQMQGAVLRITLTGRRPRSLDLDPQALALECSEGFAYLEFVDHSMLHHDLDAVGQEFTSRGEMLRKLVDRRQDDGQEEAVGRAIQLALDAFEA
jgi:DNA repair exonuclease SbcCD nuclease subunit